MRFNSIGPRVYSLYPYTKLLETLYPCGKAVQLLQGAVVCLQIVLIHFSPCAYFIIPLPFRCDAALHRRTAFRFAQTITKDRNSGLCPPSTFSKYLHYRWPPSRQRCYTFGREFNRAIDCIVWPLSLQQLTFGSYLNESIDVARLPLSLQRLVFGSSFN